MRWDLYLYAILVVALLGYAFWDRVLRDFLIDMGVLRQEPAASSTVLHHRAADYVTHHDNEAARPTPYTPPEPAFERAERPAFVPPVQLVNEGNLTYDDVVRLDTLARLVAAGTIAESTAIVAVYDGKGGVLKVSKGGSAAYEGRRNALRSLAIAYGWRPAPPEPARVTPVAERATGATFAPQFQRAPAPPAEEPAA